MEQRVPPRALDIEKAVLGAILIDKEAINVASDILRPEMFYSTSHQQIYSVITNLASKSHNIDGLTVVEALRKSGELDSAGGAFYVSSLTNSVVSSAHTLQHAQIIVERYLQRELINIGGEMYNRGFDMADPFELIEKAEKAIHQLTSTLNSRETTRIDSTLVEILKDLEEKRHREAYLTGSPTGFKELDKSTCGWQPTDLIILAARPKSGKTAFALNLALNSAMVGDGVGFFSMEMSASQLVKRILANQASMYLKALRDARLDDYQMQHLYMNGVQKLAGIPFFIDDTPSMTVAEIKSKARRLVKKEGVKLIVVDYLQLMQPEKGKKNQNREQEVSTNARQLKITAKELNVPIICLSQLSRAVEARSNPAPVLSDLRESGAIEQDADMVCFLYKPNQEESTVVFKIAAFRNGEIQQIEYDFKGEYQRFIERGIYGDQQFKPMMREEDSFPNF